MGSDLCSPGDLTTPTVNGGLYNETRAQCLSRCGGLVDPSGLPPSSDTVSTLTSLNPGWSGFLPGSSNPFGTAVNATILLQGTDSVTMSEIVETAGNNHTATHLGLAENSTLLEALYQAEAITSRSWGLNAGSQSQFHPRPGNLVLGGFDKASILGAFTEYKIEDAILGNRTCPLQVLIRSMSLQFGDGNTSSLVTTDQPLPACIEPYDNLFRLSGNVISNFYDFFEDVTGYSDARNPIPDPADRGILNLEPGLVYPYLSNSTAKFTPSMVITLENNFTVEIPAYELVRPLHGIALNGSRVSNPNFTEVQIYQLADPEEAAVLGKIFLSAAYLYVDYDAGTFQLAHINMDAADTPNIVAGDATDCSVTSDNSQSRPLAIGLIVLGVVVGLLAITVAWLLWARFRDRRAAAERDHAAEAAADRKANLAPQVLTTSNSTRDNEEAAPHPPPDSANTQEPEDPRTRMRSIGSNPDTVVGVPEFPDTGLKEIPSAPVGVIHERSTTGESVPDRHSFSTPSYHPVSPGSPVAYRRFSDGRRT
jgi:hypothetical protein